MTSSLMVLRIVAASDDGSMPQGAAAEACRPDALQAMAALSSVPPMRGGEYWTPGVLSGFFARVENAGDGGEGRRVPPVASRVAAHLPAVRAFGRRGVLVPEGRREVRGGGAARSNGSPLGEGADGGEKLVTEMTDAELLDLVRLDANAVG